MAEKYGDEIADDRDIGECVMWLLNHPGEFLLDGEGKHWVFEGAAFQWFYGEDFGGGDNPAEEGGMAMPCRIAPTHEAKS